METEEGINNNPTNNPKRANTEAGKKKDDPLTNKGVRRSVYKDHLRPGSWGAGFYIPPHREESCRAGVDGNFERTTGRRSNYDAHEVFFAHPSSIAIRVDGVSGQAKDYRKETNLANTATTGPAKAITINTSVEPLVPQVVCDASTLLVACGAKGTRLDPIIEIDTPPRDSTAWPELGMVLDSQVTAHQIRTPKSLSKSKALPETLTSDRLAGIFDVIDERVNAQNASGEEERLSHQESSDVDMSEYEAFLSKNALKKERSRKLEKRTPPSDQRGRDRKESKKASSLKFQVGSSPAKDGTSTFLAGDCRTCGSAENLRVGRDFGNPGNTEMVESRNLVEWMVTGSTPSQSST